METSKIIGLILTLLSFGILVACLLRKQESFFNIREIVVDHMHLFENSVSQYIVFYFMPLMFSVGLAMIYDAGEVFFTILTIILSIILSMLMAVLSILIEKEYLLVSDYYQRKKINKVRQETITAIIFDTLLCVLLLIFGLVMIVIEGSNYDVGLLRNVFAGLAYYIFIVILLNLLLIVKCMTKLIEIDSPSQE